MAGIISTNFTKVSTSDISVLYINHLIHLCMLHLAQGDIVHLIELHFCRWVIYLSNRHLVLEQATLFFQSNGEE